MVPGVVLYLLGPVALYVLGPGTFSLLVGNTREDRQQVLTIQNDTLNTNMEKFKAEAEQKIAKLSSSNKVLMEDLRRTKVSNRLVRCFIVTYSTYIDIETFRPRL